MDWFGDCLHYKKKKQSLRNFSPGLTQFCKFLWYLRQCFSTLVIEAQYPAWFALQDQARLRCCRQQVHWNLNMWRTIMGSDEYRLCMQQLDCRVKVWRKHGECNSDGCTNRVASFGGGIVMVWDGISLTRKKQAYHKWRQSKCRNVSIWNEFNTSEIGLGVLFVRKGQKQPRWLTCWVEEWDAIIPQQCVTRFSLLNIW